MRQRTLEAVEAIAVWQRRSGSAEPFYYKGLNYLQRLGMDLEFLERASFMRGRMMTCRVSEDPFLKELTADGMPIEVRCPLSSQHVAQSGAVHYGRHG